MNIRNFIIFDTETTGLDPANGAEIVQLAAAAVNYHDLEPHHIEPFNAYIRPQSPETAHPDALAVIGPVWDEALENGLQPKVAFNNFLKWVNSINDSNASKSKPVLVGHNVGFDIRMISHWFNHYGVLGPRDSPPWAPHLTLDTQQIYFTLMESDPTMYKFNLDSVAEKVDLGRKDNHHDALEDVLLTRELFCRAMKFFRVCNQRLKVAKNA